MPINPVSPVQQAGVIQIRIQTDPELGTLDFLREPPLFPQRCCHTQMLPHQDKELPLGENPGGQRGLNSGGWRDPGLETACMEGADAAQSGGRLQGCVLSP